MKCELAAVPVLDMETIFLALRGMAIVTGLAIAIVVLTGAIGLVTSSVALPGLARSRGIGIHVGLGIGVIVIAISIAYVVGFPTRTTAWLLLIVSALGLGILIFRRFGKWSGFSSRAVAREAAMAIVAIALLSPVMVFGLTYWTLDSNDWPAYASYANVWLAGSSPSDPDAFLTRFPDEYGVAALTSADIDKIGATSLLAFLSAILNVAPVRLESPILLALLFTHMSVVFGLVRQLGCRTVAALTLGLVAPLGFFTYFFFLSGQLGQVISILLLTCGLALLASPNFGRPFRDRAWQRGTALVGVLLFAAIASNVMVSLSVIPLWLALAFFVGVAQGRAIRVSLISPAIGLAVGLVLTLPFAGRHWAVAQVLGTGEIGRGFPPLSPFGAVGLQWTADSFSPTVQVLVLWVVVTAIFLRWSAVRASGLLAQTLIVATIIVFNGATVIFLVGGDNYGFAKWSGAAAALAVPVLLAVPLSRGNSSVSNNPTLVVVAAVALILGIARTATVPYVIPGQLSDAVNSPFVVNREHVTVSLGNYFEDGYAAALLTNPKVTTTDVIFVGPSTAPPGDLLMRRESTDECVGRMIAINALYGLCVAPVTGVE